MFILHKFFIFQDSLGMAYLQMQKFYATDMFLCVDACEPLEPLLVWHTCKSVDSRKSKCTKVLKWCKGIKEEGKKKLSRIECSKEGDLLIVLNGDNFYGSKSRSLGYQKERKYREETNKKTQSTGFFP